MQLLSYRPGKSRIICLDSSWHLLCFSMPRAHNVMSLGAAPDKMGTQTVSYVDSGVKTPSWVISWAVWRSQPSYRLQRLLAQQLPRRGFCLGFPFSEPGRVYDLSRADGRGEAQLPCFMKVNIKLSSYALGSLTSINLERILVSLKCQDLGKLDITVLPVSRYHTKAK